MTRLISLISSSALIICFEILHAADLTSDVKKIVVIAPGSHELQAGVGTVDITPTEPVTLAGSPDPLKSTTVDTRLFVKALVLSMGRQKLAIVTVDTNKYPVEQVDRARQGIATATGIPITNILICASHTHRAPFWTYYKDQLVTPIVESVELAMRTLAPARLATASGHAEGLNENRRVMKDGTAWDRWQLKPSEQDNYPAEGPADPDFTVLAVLGKDNKFKAILYDFACHAANTQDPVISADFPGDVQRNVQTQLGYEAVTFFLTGASGNVNPRSRTALAKLKKDHFGEVLGGAIVNALNNLEPIPSASITLESWELQMPGRADPAFAESDVSLKWPAQLEHYRLSFFAMQDREQTSYQFFMTGIRIGKDFAIVTSPGELFTEFRLEVKRLSPFKRTMVVEQTNGAHGYIPTAVAFRGGSYETWFGLHSYLTEAAGDIIQQDSIEILNHLKTLK